MTYCEGCSSYDCGCPEANEIKFLRQQLASRDAEVAALRELKQAWHDKFWEADKQLAAAQARLHDKVRKP